MFQHNWNGSNIKHIKIVPKSNPHNQSTKHTNPHFYQSIFTIKMRPFFRSSLVLILLVTLAVANAEICKPIPLSKVTPILELRNPSARIVHDIHLIGSLEDKLEVVLDITQCYCFTGHGREDLTLLKNFEIADAILQQEVLNKKFNALFENNIRACKNEIRKLYSLGDMRWSRKMTKSTCTSYSFLQ